MTFPPPPPDRMHLQHQPSPAAPYAPQPPQQMGPGGAYGPMQPTPDQPLPGQLPPHGLSATKPGTITGIQVILWIFLAIGGVGDVLSAISLVEYFSVFGLISLAWAAYSTIQALVSPIQIARGKRWAWIWSLVSAIIGLALAATGLVFGIVLFDTGGDIMLLITGPLTLLYGTLLGLLCSKSARQWILMHRIQRGEVQVPGMEGAVGLAQGAPAAPQRPETRPGSATFAVVLLCLLMAVSAWTEFEAVRGLIALNSSGAALDPTLISPMYGTGRVVMVVGVNGLVLVCALIAAIGLHRGSFGARVFTVVWTSVLVLAAGFLATSGLLDFIRYQDMVPPPTRSAWTLTVVRELAVVVLILAVFIAAMLPGVRAWTPGKPTAALIMVVPMGQPQGPYGQPQQGQYPPQQQPYGQAPQQQPQPPYRQPPQQPPYGGR